MKRFVEGVDRGQSTLFPECLEDWIDKDNPVRVEALNALGASPSDMHREKLRAAIARRKAG
jgi:hypothetical protein